MLHAFSMAVTAYHETDAGTCHPIQQAFLHLYRGEVHHVPRNVVPKKACHPIAYGCDDVEEQELFRKLNRA